jgi:benzoyl-CoA 2,3-dioxygenase component B
MLTEEAHHMFVGESGVSRVLARTCQVMNELKTDDVNKLRNAGVIDLPTIQRYLNFHYSVTIDLFGADQSSNAATFYSSGLKGRYEEASARTTTSCTTRTTRCWKWWTASCRRRKCPCSTP